ncbi:fascin domain-containing protein [Acaryochloris marina]|uniref:fascin domain-containing protein n=1 Tax=Acaryochloris marina TaxID=155978 RepID=UPI0021C2C56E|nr:hypothetical protein [Acaryochloris marina]BDM83767.1 hypothetical protein AM10699_66280 [Acaryochloris marina MBIC10699]
MSDGIKVCRNPAINFNGGMIMTLHATKLLCEDETEHEGVWPFEGEFIANDAMRLSGIVTTQAGPEGEPIQCQITPQNLGNDYQDGRSFNFDRELARTFISNNSQLPVASHALLMLVEEDWGGLDWDNAVKTIVDGVGEALKSGVAAGVGAAVGAGIGSSVGPIGTAIGTGLGAFAGFVTGEIAAAIKKTESDIFPAQETSFMVGTRPIRTSQIVYLRFEGHGGRYLLTLEWRVRPLPSGIERIGLQADNGDFVVAEGGGGRQLLANRPHLRSWETFGLIRLTSDRVALLAINGDFVAAEGGGGRELVANRPWIREWETFRLEELSGNRVALRASNGQYVAAEGGGGRELVANRPRRGPWETFRLHRL